MDAVSLSLVAIIALCALGLAYPFLVYPLILRLLKERPVGRGDATGLTCSLLFCAYNEAAVLPAKLENLVALKARWPDLQILAFDDGSGDGSAALLRARPDLLTLIEGGGRSGKAHGMKLLAARATGDVLIFTDANVMLAEDAIDHLRRYYADEAIGGVLGSLRYLGDKESATASVGSLYWRIEERLKDGESRSGNVMGADGSIFSIRRALYPAFPDTVLDDLTVSMSVVFAGKRLIKARDVIAYEQLVVARGDEYRRKVRIAARAWHTHGHIRPGLRAMSALDRFKYASRKILRWFGGLLLIGGALAAIALAWRIGGPVVAIGLTILAIAAILIGTRIKSGPVAALVDILLAYAATLQGVARAMRGATFAVWNPAKSR